MFLFSVGRASISISEMLKEAKAPSNSINGARSTLTQQSCPKRYVSWCMLLSDFYRMQGE